MRGLHTDLVNILIVSISWLSRCGVVQVSRGSIASARFLTTTARPLGSSELTDRATHQGKS